MPERARLWAQKIPALKLKDFIRFFVIKPGVIWHLEVVQSRPALLWRAGESRVQLLHFGGLNHSVEYCLPFSV